MPTEFAIRTRYWHLRLDPRGEPSDKETPAEHPSLYVKPDDRWEQNEIAQRCPSQVKALHAAVNDLRSAVEDDNAKAMEPLDECLLNHPAGNAGERQQSC